MNVVRFYPTEAVRLNLSKILDLSRSISANERATEQLVTMAIEQSEAAALQDSSIDYRALPVLSDIAQFEVIKQPLILDDRSRDRTYAADLYLSPTAMAMIGTYLIRLLWLNA